ncbi:MAG: transcriptional regulator [Candidatus Odinarchaeota archaeon]
MDKVNSISSSDNIFTTSYRLTIMILLHNHKRINFTEVQKLLHLTPGNLDHHVKKLENAGYLRMYKRLSLKRPLTMLEITDLGKNAFRDYIKNLRDILNNIQLDG